MFCVLFYVSSKLTGVVLLGMLVMGIGVTVFVVIMEQLGKDIQAAKAEMNTIAEETLANIRTVKAFANEKTECARFRAKNERVLALGKKRAYISGVMTLFGELVGAIVFGYLIHVAYQQYRLKELSLGDILAYLDSIIIVLLYIGGFIELCGGMAYITGAADEVIQIMRYEPRIRHEGGTILGSEIGGTLQLKNLHFSYPNR